MTLRGHWWRVPEELQVTVSAEVGQFRLLLPLAKSDVVAPASITTTPSFSFTTSCCPDAVRQKLEIPLLNKTAVKLTRPSDLRIEIDFFIVVYVPHHPSCETTETAGSFMQILPCGCQWLWLAELGAGVGVSNGWIEYSGLHGLPSEERSRIIRC